MRDKKWGTILKRFSDWIQTRKAYFGKRKSGNKTGHETLDICDRHCSWVKGEAWIWGGI